LRQLVDHLRLALAKSRLALDVENPRYIRTRALLDLVVGVQEFQFQGARQEAPMVVLPAPMGPTRKTREQAATSAAVSRAACRPGCAA
jgi:predicted dienelactone hydrolase